jgi:hypothetical protein
MYELIDGLITGMLHHCSSHCSTSSGGGVIGLVFIIIKLMQGVVKEKGSSCSYCPDNAKHLVKMQVLPLV